MAARTVPTVILVAAAFVGLVSIAILALFGGWEYYRAPLATRGYLPAHRWLRPSGAIGLTLGVAGAVAMVSTLPYAVRKRWRPMARLGSMRGWLEVHIFFGIVGPLLVTLHTSFKFNGLISVGYWLMMTVWASGFVGRYLYVRIPRSIRGAELTQQEVRAQLDTAASRVASSALPAGVHEALARFASTVTPADGRAPGAVDLFVGELRVRARLATMARDLRAAGIDAALVHEAVSLATEHAAATRRLVHLQRTRRFFELWHVFHQPLVFAMFAIVVMHVGIALYFGYVSFVTEPS
jgi:hypothetical protein